MESIGGGEVRWFRTWASCVHHSALLYQWL